MDEAKLTEIEARANAATPGPWFNTGYADDDDLGPHIENSDEHAVALCGIGVAEHLANGAFLTAARTDVPDLVAEVRRLTAALGAARREGAEGMRERAAQACERIERGAAEALDEVGYDSARVYVGMRDAAADAIRALPLDGDGGAR